MTSQSRAGCGLGLTGKGSLGLRAGSSPATMRQIVACAGHSDWAVLLVGERERGGRGTPQQRHPEEQDRRRNGNDEEPGEAGVRPADAGLAGLAVVVSVATNTTRARSHRAAGSWRVNHRGIPAAHHAAAPSSVNGTASGSTSDPSSWVGAQRRYRPAVRGGESSRRACEGPCTLVHRWSSRASRRLRLARSMAPHC